jgi:hypothetical protein
MLRLLNYYYYDDDYLCTGWFKSNYLIVFLGAKVLITIKVANNLYSAGKVSYWCYIYIVCIGLY